VVFIVDGATDVVASRSGRVRSIAEREQGGSTKLQVSVDHGDGTLAVYQMDPSDHLFVSEGDPLCRGQQIGQLDTTSSQLWFDVRDLRGFSKPIVFPESDTFDQGGRQGSFTTFESYTSQTERVLECPRTSFSQCDENIFLHRGVVLDDESPCSVIPESEDVTVSGRVLLDGYPVGSTIAYWSWVRSTSSWELECIPIVEGRFSMTHSWSDGDGTGFVPWVWQVATESCESYDWGETPWEPELRLLAPPIDDVADEIPPPTSPDEVVCGLGTTLSDDDHICVVDETCGPHHSMLLGRCHRIDGISTAFPFEEGTVTPILGGHHAYLSHRGQYTHAMDFDVPEGTVIVAARAGLVIDVYEETVGNGGTANQITIEHDDGTTGEYLHLQHQGALVDVGERVCVGQPIGLSGNTGWSDSPHLHLEVRDAFGYSQPLQFIEAEHPTGLLMAGREYESTTVVVTDCHR
jgi:murein DD-endopeptidase MepM/ murein hydrolase activator NlpD